MTAGIGAGNKMSTLFYHQSYRVVNTIGVLVF